MTTPTELANPILPYRNNGITLYPEGSWTARDCWDELLNALNYGYKFELLEGYLFEGSNLFSTYVECLNETKEQAEPDPARYLIAKLLLNSLYGRFGMKPKVATHEVVKTSEVSKLIARIGLENLISQVELGDMTLISYWPKFSRLPKINIAIAATITANARVFMSDFKNLPDNSLYYTDTDSGYYEKPLPGHLIDSKKLGFSNLCLY